MQKRGNRLFETDNETGLSGYHSIFTAKPNVLSGRAFRGETDAHLGVESQFTVIFYVGNSVLFAMS